MCKISSHVTVQNFELRRFIVVSHSLGRKFFERCKINELTCAYMFSQAHLQKNTHKKVFSLVEISNICCVFLLRLQIYLVLHANSGLRYETGDCVVWYKICVACMNFLASVYIVIFVFSRDLCVFMLLLTI